MAPLWASTVLHGSIVSFHGPPRLHCERPRSSTAPLWASKVLHGSIVSVQGPPRLHCGRPRLHCERPRLHCQRPRLHCELPRSSTSPLWASAVLHASIVSVHGPPRLHCKRPRSRTAPPSWTLALMRIRIKFLTLMKITLLFHQTFFWWAPKCFPTKICLRSRWGTRFFPWSLLSRPTSTVVWWWINCHLCLYFPKTSSWQKDLLCCSQILAILSSFYTCHFPMKHCCVLLVSFLLSLDRTHVNSFFLGVRACIPCIHFVFFCRQKTDGETDSGTSLCGQGGQVR